MDNAILLLKWAQMSPLPVIRLLLSLPCPLPGDGAARDGAGAKKAGVCLLFFQPFVL